MKGQRICVVGVGYVGLVTGACLAEIGHRVVCVDSDVQKIAMLQKGRIPIYEPGLDALVAKNVRRKRLSFATKLTDGLYQATVVFIAVGTPPRSDGSADLTHIEAVAREIANNLHAYTVIAEKSTVPVETGEQVERTIMRYNRNNVPFDVVSNPEFLREGTAIADFLHPDRIVIGGKSKRARKVMTDLYAPLKAHVVLTDLKSAELIKHASNSFLATKISFINSVARVCELVGADATQVAEGMGLDPRIGRSFLSCGIGFGGFCLPKDLEAFRYISQKVGYDFDLLRAVKEVNDQQRALFVKKVEESVWVLKGKVVAVLGIAFKPHTDDIRFAPSVDIIRRLQSQEARIRAYDPVAMPKAEGIVEDVTFCKTPYEAVTGADCIAITTEWPEFKKLDFRKVKKLMTQPVIVDGRNVLDPDKILSLGFEYHGMGRVK
ncbi:MAG TPA: UDP-glucose/GDP-mannose dehydrogenase family protein [Elusimicrobiota bacterium]|nr:UDP-glucose/GDP-mannose dehydrogenase family protein [Elusimicrobiota bacterium]